MPTLTSASSSTAAGGRPSSRTGAAPARRRTFTSRRGLVILAYLTPAIVFVGLFTYYPMLTGGQMAFRQWNLYDLTEKPWVGLDNFERIVSHPDFGRILRNTVVWVVASIVPQFVIGFAIALWLRRRFAFRGVYQALIFFPWAISGFLIGILFRWMFSAEFGVINDLLRNAGIIDKPIPWLADPAWAMVAAITANVWYGVTFFAIMILAALQSVPDDVYEAAALDGAGKARTLFAIVIPSILTTLALTVLLRVIWILNFPDIIWAMTGGGPANQTHILTTWMIVITQNGDYGGASAVGLIIVACLFVFSAFYLMALRKREDWQ